MEAIGKINTEFGSEEAPITISRGKVHEYLGMTIDYSIPGKVSIKMLDYVDNMLNGLPEGMDGESTTPALAHLFEANDTNLKYLDEEKAQFFHRNMAKACCYVRELQVICRQRWPFYAQE